MNTARPAGRLRRRIARWLPLSVILLLPVAVLGPLYARGYILRYDMVFAPHMHFGLEAARQGSELYHAIPVTALLKLLSFALPMDIVQKVLLTMVLLLSAYVMYRILPVRSAAARLAAALMYTLNPFVYDRLMAGHWNFLLAYSVTPLALWAMYRLVTTWRRRYLLYAVLAWSLTATLNAHHLVIVGILFLGLALIFVRSLRGAAYAAALVAGVALLNSWWIIPAMMTSGAAYSFGSEHFYAFATRADPDHGIWFNMLALQGFWSADWQTIKHFFAFWPALVFAWLLPVYLGLAALPSLSRDGRRLVIGLLLASLPALLFAAGPYPPVTALNVWLFETVPGLAGMREPQKLLALVALMYAVVAAYGLDWAVRQRQSRRPLALLPVAAVTVSVATTLLIASPMLWGARGQLDLTAYPASWHAFREHLQAAGDDGKAVVLPWEHYVDRTFVDTLVANPAKQFYGDRAIVSTRMNLPGVPEREPPGQAAIGGALDAKDVGRLRQAMRQSGAGYVMLTETSRLGDYAWLVGHPSAVTVISDDHLHVIRLTSR